MMDGRQYGQGLLRPGRLGGSAAPDRIEAGTYERPAGFPRRVFHPPRRICDKMPALPSL
ncbi:MAG: hypothetical protein KAJ01_06390 [Candidatus Hydrogenedentes bacterium]|nr:hypothetical protein [Candidatus Hydrogenedentota bacterium]